MLVQRRLAAQLNLLSNVTARDDTGETAFRVNYRQEALFLAMIGTKRTLHIAESAGCGERGDFGAHDFARKEKLKWIDGGFAAEMVAATSDFLGEDGALQGE